ncbi:MAG: glucosaminidase domain-containing protein [Aureispira sp.]
MRNLLTNLALCVALPFTLDSSNEAFAKNVVALNPPTPDFSIIEPEHARAYINKIYPYAWKVQEEKSIPIAITLAIACLESGYGTSDYAQTRHNHFGIRAYHNGKAGYRRFSDLDECFEFYSNMFSLERYAPLQEIPLGDLPAFAQGLQDCGFNHRDAYTKKLLIMIQFLKLEELTASMA